MTGFGQCGLEPLDPQISGVFVLPTAQKHGRGVNRQSGQQAAGQFQRPAHIVGHNRERVPSGQVDIDTRNTGLTAHHIDLRRILDSGQNQKLDLLRDHGCADLILDLGYALCAADDGDQPAPMGFMFEMLGQTGKEPVAMMRDNQP